MDTYLKKTFGIILISLIMISLFNKSAFSQSEIKPVHAVWMADDKPVSLKRGYTGVIKPNELTLKLFFEKNISKKYSNEDLKLVFKWFHFYSTKKEFMDSYTISYDKNFETLEKVISASSKRSNITKGWWEVVVIAKYDNKPITFGAKKRFIIFFKWVQNLYYVPPALKNPLYILLRPIRVVAQEDCLHL